MSSADEQDGGRWGELFMDCVTKYTDEQDFYGACRDSLRGRALMCVTDYLPSSSLTIL